MQVYDIAIGKRITDNQIQAGLFQSSSVLTDECCWKKSAEQSKEIHGWSNISLKKQIIHDTYSIKSPQCSQIQIEPFEPMLEIVTTKSQEEDSAVDKSCEDLANEQLKNRTLKKSFHDLERQFEEEKSINQHLKEDLKEKSIEINKLREDLTNEKLKNRTLKISFHDLERQFEEEKLINQQMQKNQCNLKEDLEKQSIEINELQSQVHDLMFHIIFRSKFASLRRATKSSR